MIGQKISGNISETRLVIGKYIKYVVMKRRTINFKNFIETYFAGVRKTIHKF
ncbi:hypothetical protein CGLAMM_00225 [Acetobacteraceae bacterium EV16G]|uniref:Uncharacterized protein n=1 Tax=Sorlinia euscelidii TaxID=3081148 RepID=A0ABU7U3L4_9PROT